MQSLRGHFLLASPSLRDDSFVQSVILVIRHDVEGAIGLIINRPLEATVADALGDELAVDVQEPLRRGGPCEGPMMVIHDLGQLESGDEVLPGIFYTHARSDIETVMAAPTPQALYVIGYAGWQPDQLEREMAEGSWSVLPASSTEVFSVASDLWHRLSTRARLLKFLPPDRIPDDPGLN
jgi:putative transcriptional regulator